MRKFPRIACLLVLSASFCVAAYASPKDEKITLACSAFAPDIITGSATVTLCADPACGQTVSCPAMYCDSSGINTTPSTTLSCSATFKVTAITYTMNYQDTDIQTGNSIVCSGSISGGPTLLQKGSVAFANSATCTNNSSGLTDTMTLMIK
jgi:hypothetical protein